MKVRVIKPFADRVTGSYRPAGAEIDVSPARARELMLGAAGAYIEPVEENKPEPKTETGPAARKPARKGK